MQSASPVHCNVTLPTIKSRRAFHAPTSADATKFKETVEYWTVVADVVFALFFCVVVHVVWRDFLKEIDVLVCMKLGHFEFRSGFCSLLVNLSA